MREDYIIKKYIAPLAHSSKSAQSLGDDVAWFPKGINGPLVISSDVLVESVHFLKDSNAAAIAKKLWAVNVSDLAGKGARPLGFILNIALPEKIAHDDNWLAEFFSSAQNCLTEWGGNLWGGDTVASPDSIMLSLTVFGKVAQEKIPTRNSAKPGETLFVSGTLGDSFLGLCLCKEPDNQEEKLSAEEKSFLCNRYLYPQPRLEFGINAAAYISAMMDISDGLCADLTRLCLASAVAAEITSDNLPISSAAKKFPQKYLQAALNGGDDYELLFSAADEYIPMIQRIGQKTNTKITAIGKIIAGEAGKITVKNLAGENIKIPPVFMHF